ncbi:MAG: hypothetical protein J5I94_21230 [Phaeodactylibacter sp.]|nr:hypothetical protein [Phaeodactylibacter sp.]
MQQSTIPGIYNYCDRWCERCPFTGRCLLYAQEQELTEEQKDPGNPAFWEVISESFQKAIELLYKAAEEQGIDLDAVVDEAAEEPEPEMPPHHQALYQTAHDYTVRGIKWLENNRDAFEEVEAEINRQLRMGIDKRTEGVELGEALSVVQWYAGMVSAKTFRALKGYEDMDEDFWAGPHQSDANGSAKMALICIERSLGAWKIILNHLPDRTDELLGLLVLLERSRRGLKQAFPDAEKFIRPGFDEQ